MRGNGRAALAAVAGAMMLLLAGCVGSPADPTGSPSGSVSASVGPTTRRSATPSAAPTLAPGGSAEQNHAFFDSVNERLFSSNGTANGRAIIDNLVAAGFAKVDMQLTPDKTSINGTVDSILFSVRFGNDCLIGQHGGSGYSSTVQPALAGGTCIVGRTRTIDW